MAHTDDTVLYSIDSVLYKHLNHETTEAEERRLYAWLEEREEHRTFYFEIAAIWSAHKTLSSKQLGERCERHEAPGSTRGSTPTKRCAAR